MRAFDDAVLREQGLNLQGVLNADDARACGLQLTPDTQLVVLGHGGQDLWRHVSTEVPVDPIDDPVDRYTLRCVHGWLEREGIQGAIVHYPLAEDVLDLNRLGQRLGWSFDSPLGTGIHPSYGLWFAYRAVVSIPVRFVTPKPPASAHPCEVCVGRDCEKACPVGAVSGAGFALETCAGERMRQDSGCAYTCHARLACPVGRQHRYQPAQIEYHYGLSLKAIARYSDENKPDEG